MTVYKNLKTSEAATEAWLKALGWNIENPALLAEAGWLEISYEYPEYDGMTQKIEPAGDPELNAARTRFIQKFVVAPLAPEILEANAQALAVERANEARAQADAAVAPLLAEFSEVERHTWPQQREEVAAWQADNAAPTPTLDALAGHRGISREEMLAKASAKVAAFAQVSVAVVGRQQGYEDQIKDIAANEAMGARERILALRALAFEYEVNQ